MTVQEWTVVWISFKTASVAVLADLPLAVGIGYGLARWSSRGKALLETVVNLPLVLPPVVTGYLLLLLFGRRGPIGSFLEHALGLRITFTWMGAALASAVVSFPLMVRTMRLAFESVNPRLENAARTLGAGPVGTFFRISLPLALRGVVAGCVLGFARSLGEFGATIILAGNIEGETQTIPLAIFSLVQRPGGLGQSGRLVILSILLSCTALLASEYLDRRGKIRDAS